MQEIPLAVARLMDARAVYFSVISTEVCEECAASCWTLQIRAHGVAGGESYITYLLEIQHLEQGEALRRGSQWLLGRARMIEDLDNRRWMIEHQMTLDIT